MQMYVVVNVENLKLYEPPLIDDQGEHVQIPSIDDFSPDYLTELQEDTILDRRMRTSKQGNVEYLRVGLKGMNPRKAKWWGGVIRGSNFAQISKCSECDENSAIASVSSS
jgi:hypothetical protein